MINPLLIVDPLQVALFNAVMNVATLAFFIVLTVWIVKETTLSRRKLDLAIETQDLVKVLVKWADRQHVSAVKVQEKAVEVQEESKSILKDVQTVTSQTGAGSKSNLPTLPGDYLPGAGK
jgi:hypothetical protein